MGYYTREDIPFQFALAEAFTICDAYHCSVMGPTWPNRMYWMTGTIDPEGTGGGPMIQQLSFQKAGSAGRTYPERLAESRRELEGLSAGATTTAATCWSTSGPSSRPTRDPHLHNRGMLHGPEGQFEYDASHDKLPAVSWIIPTSDQSEHPDYMPAAGAAFVASKIDAIAANPEVWAKTVFILNYDENDGIFDHVAPPVPPPGTPREFVEGCRSAADSACPASSFRPGPPAAGYAASRSTTRRCSVPGEVHRRAGAQHQRLADARPSAI